jgi:hypothetical protein
MQKKTQVSTICGFIALSIQNIPYYQIWLIEHIKYNQLEADYYNILQVLRKYTFIYSACL